MLLDFFKKRNNQYIEVEPISNKKRSRILVILIIAAIIVLAFGGMGEEKDEVNKEGPKLSDEILAKDYIDENEKRLTEILSKVQGAGSVKAMITIDNLGEKIIATDKKNESSQESDDEKISKESKNEQTAIVYGAKSEEKPFVVEEKLPMPSGVLVVATGAGDETVRLEIYEAVRALYGISGHRIKIAKGSLK